jgi:hypothetical protein
MALSTAAKNWINRGLASGNLRLETLTAQRDESERISRLERRGHFDTPIYSLEGLASVDVEAFVAAWPAWADQLETLAAHGDREVGFDPANRYFMSPDMEALFLVAQIYQPKRWVEVGCGNSTRLLQRAIIDGPLATQVIAIDPNPRVDIARISGQIHRARLEDYCGSAFSGLGPGDVVFIDSSHGVFAGNDVACLFLQILPSLPSGVIVHVHDVFLPYEYPIEWVREGYGWNEQYLLHSFLNGAAHRILWPGYHLQRDRPDIVTRLPFLRRGRAQSFWFQIG